MAFRNPLAPSPSVTRPDTSIIVTSPARRVVISSPIRHPAHFVCKIRFTLLSANPRDRFPTPGVGSSFCSSEPQPSRRGMRGRFDCRAAPGRNSRGPRCADIRSPAGAGRVCNPSGGQDLRAIASLLVAGDVPHRRTPRASLSAQIVHTQPHRSPTRAAGQPTKRRVLCRPTRFNGAAFRHSGEESWMPR